MKGIFMIKHFSVLYVGNIELDSVGAYGTPSDERTYGNEKLVQSFKSSEEIAKLMDKLGFYALWMAEHHFQTEGYECIPNIPLLSVHLAKLTTTLKFGCAFNIVPMWHPLRLAEDYATADILTNGRVIFGVGRGYHSREVETFGSPVIDNQANRELFEEQITIIQKAFNCERFSHVGKHYTIPPDVKYRGYHLKDITLVPRPINLPVETWQPIVSGNSIDFIARNGFRGVVSLTGEKLVEQIFHQCKESFSQYGPEAELGENLALGVGFYIADNQDEAIKKLKPYHDERYKWFAPFGFVRYADEEGRPWGTPGAPARTPTLKDGIDQKAWLCGSPDQILEYLRGIEAQYPALEHIILVWPEGMPRTMFMNQLQVFAKEVMPYFNES